MDAEKAYIQGRFDAVPYVESVEKKDFIGGLMGTGKSITLSKSEHKSKVFPWFEKKNDLPL